MPEAEQPQSKRELPKIPGVLAKDEYVNGFVPVVLTPKEPPGISEDDTDINGKAPVKQAEPIGVVATAPDSPFIHEVASDQLLPDDPTEPITIREPASLGNQDTKPGDRPEKDDDTEPRTISAADAEKSVNATLFYSFDKSRKHVGMFSKLVRSLESFIHDDPDNYFTQVAKKYKRLLTELNDRIKTASMSELNSTFSRENIEDLIGGVISDPNIISLFTDILETHIDVVVKNRDEVKTLVERGDLQSPQEVIDSAGNLEDAMKHLDLRRTEPGVQNTMAIWNRAKASLLDDRLGYDGGKYSFTSATPKTWNTFDYHFRDEEHQWTKILDPKMRESARNLYNTYKQEVIQKWKNEANETRDRLTKDMPDRLKVILKRYVEKAFAAVNNSELLGKRIEEMNALIDREVAKVDMSNYSTRELAVTDKFLYNDYRTADDRIEQPNRPVWFKIDSDEFRSQESLKNMLKTLERALRDITNPDKQIV